MSVDLCQRITLNRNKNIIKISVASSNVFPKSYDTCEYCNSKYYKHYSFEDKLLALFVSMQSGNIHISSINDNTEHFEYAMLKVRQYLRENNIDSYQDLYEEKNKLYSKQIYSLAKIELSQLENESDRHYENWKRYEEWKKSQNQEYVKDMEEYIELEVLWEVYGKAFEVFKKALEEEISGSYKLLYGTSPIIKMKRYSWRNGYGGFYIGCGKIEEMSYKRALIIQDNLKEKKLEIVKV